MFSDEALRKVLDDLQFHIPTIDLDILLDERPDLVRQRSTMAMMGYPLHEACLRGLPLPVIQKFVDRFPEAVTANFISEESADEQDDNSYWGRQTPLFAACSRVEPRMETISYLVQLDYPSCLIGTSDRPPLLHWCMSIWNQPLAVWTALVDWVWEQYPEAADLADFNGRYAIHHATSMSDLPRFRQLLQKYNQKKCDKNGQNQQLLIDAHGNHLLHLAVADSHRVPQNVTCILEECPTAVSWANHRGELPVHVAIKKHDRNLLLEQYPFAMLHMSSPSSSSSNGDAGGNDPKTVFGNVRRELGRCMRVYYLEVGEVVDGDEDEDDAHADTDSNTIRREDEDWEFPSVSWIYPTEPLFLGELDRLMDILNQQVLPPLRQMFKQACQSCTGTSLPPEVLNEILLFAVPHYEEALTHTQYHKDPTFLNCSRFQCQKQETTFRTT